MNETVVKLPWIGDPTKIIYRGKYLKSASSSGG